MAGSRRVFGLVFKVADFFSSKEQVKHVIRIGKLFLLGVFAVAALYIASCHEGKGLSGEDNSTGWELKLDAHPDTVPIGTNDTIFVEVCFDGEPQGGITVTFEPTFGDPIPDIITVINDTTIPWGTQPMATFISRDDTGLATIYGSAYRTENEVLAEDSIFIQVIDSL